MVWKYLVDDKEKELKGVIWSVADKATGNPITMVGETKSGDRSEAGGIPLAYKGRVSIEEQASLVIENVTLDDSTTFTCTLLAEVGSGVLNEDSPVQLIVTGMCIFVTKLCIFLK